MRAARPKAPLGQWPCRVRRSSVRSARPERTNVTEVCTDGRCSIDRGPLSRGNRLKNRQTTPYARDVEAHALERAKRKGEVDWLR